MPIDWDEIDKVIDKAAESTDQKLASRISSLTRMTDEEIQDLFPNPADKEKLTKLMKIVKSSEDRNTKVNKIVANAEEFGGTVLSLIGRFV